MPTIKGTASVVDDHAMAKQLKQTKFPEIFSKKVDMKKVNVPVVSQWVEKEIAELLGMEDEIVASTAINLFLEPQEATDPRRAQLNLVGFLTEEKAAIFAESLWTLLLDAQDQNSGIPRKLLEEKKAELQKQKEEERKNQAAQRNIPRDARGGRDENRRNHGNYQRDFVRPYDNRPPAQFSQGHRPPAPPRFRSNEARAVSPRRPSTDEFGRVVQDEDYERRPREGPRERRDRRYGRRYDDNDYRHDRRDYRDRRGRDDRRHYDRDYPRYSDHAEYRRRRRHSHERRRRRSPSFSTSRSRSVSPSSSFSRSSSESRSRSRSRS